MAGICNEDVSFRFLFTRSTRKPDATRVFKPPRRQSPATPATLEGRDEPRLSTPNERVRERTSR